MGLAAETRADWRRWLFPLLLILLGLTLRGIRFGADRSLWGDEAALALNISSLSFAELAGPLDHAQVAPVGFLVAVKVAVSALGESELSLRAVPFLAAILSLPLFWVWSGGFLNRGAALVGLALFAVAEPLVYYGAELKQYSTDLLAALAILWVATRLCRDGPSAGRALKLALIGGAAIWFSHPAVFVCAGCGCVLLLLGWSRREGGLAAAAGIACAVWALAFLAEYLLVLRHTPARAGLDAFWRTGFPPWSAALWAWIPRTFVGLFEDPVGLRPAALGAGCFLLGIIAWGRRNLGFLMLLLAPILATLLASALHLYPFATNAQDPVISRYTEMFHPQLGRVVLFTVPLWIAVVAAGVGKLVSARRKSVRAAGAILLAALLALPAVEAARNSWAPPEIHDVRGLVGELARRHERDDVVLAQTYSREIVSYYLRRNDWRPLLQECKYQESRDAERLARAIEACSSGTRLWLVSVHHPRWGSKEEQGRIVGLLSRRARARERIDRFRASAILFEVR